jgi:aconitate hydratase
MGIADGVAPGKKLQATVTYEDGSEKQITLLARIDTAGEAEYFRHGGILHYVLRQLAAA